jgi:hypothetical protein
MKRVFATLVALSIAGSVAWAGQMTPALKDQPGPAGEAPAQPGAKAVEGKITSTDGFGKSVTLEDGTQLTIPDSLKAARDSLKAGAFVKATYEERGTEKIVTSIEVRPEDKKPKP